MIKKNVPYVKIYKDGILTNPITKEQPYLNNTNPFLVKRNAFRMWRKIQNKFFNGMTAVNGF